MAVSTTQLPSLPQTLPISETFLSLQGEGKLTGVPSFFIRTSGCNLRCTWCDTPYASWNPEYSPMSIGELTDLALGSKAKHVVLTGGEPMLFPNIEPLAQALHTAGMHITIETAGTISRHLPCDLMSLSPKLSNSTPAPNDPRDPKGALRVMHESRRINLPALQGLIDSFPTRQLKFVVKTDADIAEIKDLLGHLKGWMPEDILLMPEGVTVPSANFKSWLVNQCLENSWRYCPRLHIDLFGNTRGT